MKSLNVRQLPVAISLSAVVVIGLFVAVHLYQVNRDNHKINKSLGSQTAACDVFSFVDAAKLLQASVHQSKNQLANSSSRDMKVTSCEYTSPAKGYEDLVAGLVIRSPQTKAGVKDNLQTFESALGNQKVSGLGQSAYWDAKKGEINILSHNTRYILTYGSKQANKRSLGQTSILAYRLLPSLSGKTQLLQPSSHGKTIPPGKAVNPVPH